MKGKKLENKYVEALSEAYVTRNINNLIFILDELIRYGTHENLPLMIKEYARLNMEDFMPYVIENASKYYGDKLVVQTILLLEVSYDGVTEKLLKRITGFSDVDILTFLLGFSRFIFTSEGRLHLSRSFRSYFREKYDNIRLELRKSIVVSLDAMNVDNSKLELIYQLYNLKEWYRLYEIMSYPSIFDLLWSKDKKLLTDSWRALIKNGYSMSVLIDKGEFASIGSVLVFVGEYLYDPVQSVEIAKLAYCNFTETGSVIDANNFDGLVSVAETLVQHVSTNSIAKEIILRIMDSNYFDNTSIESKIRTYSLAVLAMRSEDDSESNTQLVSNISSLSLVRESGDKLLAPLNRALGLWYLYNQDYEKAKVSLSKALNAIENEDIQNKHIYYEAMASLNEAMQDYYLEVKMLRNAIKAFTLQLDAYNQKIIDLNNKLMNVFYYDIQWYDYCIDYAKSNLDIYDKLNIHEGFPYLNTIYIKGMAQFMNSNYVEAYLNINIALNAIRNTCSSWFSDRCMQSLQKLDSHVNEIIESFETENYDSKEVVPVTQYLTVKAQVYKKRGRLEESEDLYLKAFEIRKKYNYTFGFIASLDISLDYYDTIYSHVVSPDYDLLRNIASIFETRNEINSFIEVWDKMYWAEMLDREEYYIKLSEMYKKLGDNVKSDECLDLAHNG